MAVYKYSSYVKTSTSDAFDTIYEPGSKPAHSGIYRCEGCGKEISHNAGVSLPPQNHHQHTVAQGKVRWRMSVYAETNG
ncbi:aminoglycoside 6-N-acetyltransferase [Fimbriimonas ginsengisoli Gsoil 348]|uniref:Aminoglycoside 6-N-acetyltransferase n=1 Tax=Fimbriimonas ginsengisoli Gsoil 348 TaxID=661478 RepID=A0A068NRL9_FIMGI|nr:aminoglycoside 6-N-acetyltransferase [Fimbriimonas ginsengisoli Gsoil 348]